MRYWRDENGAALIYVSFLMVALVGIAGLALDSGRLFSLRHEMQNAADAAALAGAWQLDGTTLGALDAEIAARTTPVVTNNQKFGNTAGTVSIASVQFMASVPASDDAALTYNPAPTNPPPNNAPAYDYVEVTTTGVAQNTLLMRVLGGASPVTLTAKAVARKGSAVCQVTPLAICNPNEDPALGGTGATFDPAVWYGKQIRLRQHGAGAQWAPGEFGFLDTPAFQQSAKAVAEAVAEGNGNACYSTQVSTRPGQVNAANTAFNTRFDIYENPFFGSANDKTDKRFAPAQNVTKGFDTTPPGNSYCNSPAQSANYPVDAVSLPRDANITSTNRFGNGVWNCFDYWAVAHGATSGSPAAPPANCANPVTGGMTRFDIYRYEIANNLIPQPNAPLFKEDGDPRCHTGTKPSPWTPTAPGTLQNDRRILTFAVLNCLEYDLHGNESNIPVEAFVNGFMTEPVLANPDPELYLEVVGWSAGGNGGTVPVVLRDWVELVR